MTPKSLLRHKLAVSALADFTPGSRFDTVIGEIDKLVPDAQIRRVVLCSGKVYYDLLTERRESGIHDVAIVRVEQLHPFPVQSLPPVLTRYPAAEVVWCQEEPENYGAWTFVDRRLERMLGGLDIAAKRPVFVGRPEAASPATGLAKAHTSEQAALIRAALTPA
jgi:2-oxoglutarate dehydrogenase E1 component